MAQEQTPNPQDQSQWYTVDPKYTENCKQLLKSVAEIQEQPLKTAEGQINQLLFEGSLSSLTQQLNSLNRELRLTQNRISVLLLVQSISDVIGSRSYLNCNELLVIDKLICRHLTIPLTETRIATPKPIRPYFLAEAIPRINAALGSLTKLLKFSNQSNKYLTINPGDFPSQLLAKELPTFKTLMPASDDTGDTIQWELEDDVKVFFKEIEMDILDDLTQAQLDKPTSLIQIPENATIAFYAINQRVSCTLTTPRSIDYSKVIEKNLFPEFIDKNFAIYGGHSVKQCLGNPEQGLCEFTSNLAFLNETAKNKSGEQVYITHSFVLILRDIQRYCRYLDSYHENLGTEMYIAFRTKLLEFMSRNIKTDADGIKFVELDSAAVMRLWNTQVTIQLKKINI
jgi:hypothetical protein